MDNLKDQLKTQLISNMVIDKCKECSNVIIQESWCSHNGTVRFTTPLLNELFSKKDDRSGIWNNGLKAMYVVKTSVFSLDVELHIDNSNLSYDELETRNKLNENKIVNTNEITIINSWSFTDKSNDINVVIDKFVAFISTDIKTYESKLKEILKHKADNLMEEGETYSTVLNKYERNKKAREKCLEHYGRVCQVCGIDFGKLYGPEFADKIEVHHIVPISEIGEKYVVDPIKDLIPVCPNCHTALHSKKDGVYTVKELKVLLAKK